MGTQKYTRLLDGARKTEELRYVERLANVPIPDRTAPKLVPARFPSPTLKGPSLNIITNIESGRILCIKETEGIIV